MTTTPIFTFQDVVELIWEVMNPGTKPPTGRELRLAKHAVITAYRDISNMHAWNYFKRRRTITTEANYSTGTIAYDHTGGSNEREVTLTTGTWPDNAARGVLVISNKHYPVESRVSDTVITLDANINPGADVAASTSYEWYRESYPLPVDFIDMDTIIESTSGGNPDPLEFLPPDSHLFATRYESGSTTSDPEWYTILGSTEYVGGMSIVFGRAPNAASTYDMLYKAAPRALREYKEATGTISCVAGTTAVTGSGTAFTAFHVGSIIRFTQSTTSEPTSPIGNVDGTTNPFLAQRMITAVASATALTIDSAVSASTAISAAKFTISDPVDIEPIVMRSLFEAMALHVFAKRTKRKDANLLWQDVLRERDEAMQNDVRVNLVRSVSEIDVGTNNWGTVDVDP